MRITFLYYHLINFFFHFELTNPPTEVETTIEVTTSEFQLPSIIEVNVISNSVFNSGEYIRREDSWENGGCVLYSTDSGFALECGADLATLESSHLVPPPEAQWTFGASSVYILTKSECNCIDCEETTFYQNIFFQSAVIRPASV